MPRARNDLLLVPLALLPLPRRGGGKEFFPKKTSPPYAMHILFFLSPTAAFFA